VWPGSGVSGLTPIDHSRKSSPFAFVLSWARRHYATIFAIRYFFYIFFRVIKPEAAKISFFGSDRCSQEAEQFLPEAPEKIIEGKKNKQERHDEMENEEECAQYVEKGTGPTKEKLR